MDKDISCFITTMLSYIDYSLRKITIRQTWERKSKSEYDKWYYFRKSYKEKDKLPFIFE
jgi:hypothetical protein